MKPPRFREAAGLAALVAAWAAAQEPFFMEAATHPGKDRAYVRVLLTYADLDRTGESVDRVSAEARTAVGLLPHLALLVDGEWLHERSAGRSASGVSTLSLRLKARVLRRDSSPLNTWRASLLAGADIPGPGGDLSPDHAVPRLGAVTTAILGRHGVNAQVEWTGNHEAAAVFAFHASYLYRLAPARYSIDTAGSWYAVAESLNEWTDGGASQSDAAVSLLYEARRWAWEIGVRLPLADHRWNERLNVQAGTGARMLF